MASTYIGRLGACLTKIAITILQYGDDFMLITDYTRGITKTARHYSTFCRFWDHA